MVTCEVKHWNNFEIISVVYFRRKIYFCRAQKGEAESQQHFGQSTDVCLGYKNLLELLNHSAHLSTCIDTAW